MLAAHQIILKLHRSMIQSYKCAPQTLYCDHHSSNSTAKYLQTMTSSLPALVLAILQVSLSAEHTTCFNLEEGNCNRPSILQSLDSIFLYHLYRTHFAVLEHKTGLGVQKCNSWLGTSYQNVYSHCK